MPNFRLLRSVRGRLLLAAVVVEAVMLTLLIGNSLRLLREHMAEQERSHARQMEPVLNAALVAPLAQLVDDAPPAPKACHGPLQKV